MHTPDTQYVYHGSHELFETVIPKQNRRRNKDGEIIFDAISFHTTPYYWIALNYLCVCQNKEVRGENYWYSTGIDLYKYKEVIDVYGVDSLEESLDVLYGKGGYVYTYDVKDFFHTEGLGNFEVITDKSVEPLHIKKIDDPVSELRKLGITFNFIDLAKSDSPLLF